MQEFEVREQNQRPFKNFFYHQFAKKKMFVENFLIHRSRESRLRAQTCVQTTKS